MPTYEYKCNKCGHRFEKFQSILASPIKKCPECGKNAVERLISAGGGLIFKGSGFYITDYRDSSYTDKAKAETAASTTDSKPATSDKDAKPAASSESKGEQAQKTDKPAETKTETKTEAKPAKPEPKPTAKSSSAKSSSKKR